MVIAFDYSRLGRVGSGQPSLIVAVNGREVFFDHGIDLTNGRFGTLGICRDGRYVYEVHPAFLQGFTGRDEFVLTFDDGSRYRLVIRAAGGKTRATLFARNPETGHWEEQPSPDLAG